MLVYLLFNLFPHRQSGCSIFFPQLDNGLLPNTIKQLTNEFNRIQQLAEQQSSTQVFATFLELIRPREQLVRYSTMRSVARAAKPTELLAQLSSQLVQ